MKNINRRNKILEMLLNTMKKNQQEELPKRLVAPGYREFLDYELNNVHSYWRETMRLQAGLVKYTGRKDVLLLSNDEKLREELTSLLQQLLPDPQFNKDLVETIKEGISRGNPGIVLDAWVRVGDCIANNKDPMIKEKLHEIDLISEAVVKIVVKMHHRMWKTGCELREAVWGEWESALTNLEVGKQYDKFGIAVCLRSCLAKLQYVSPVYSASFVTDYHPDFYQGGSLPVGYYYRPQCEDVIGMDCTDAVTCFRSAGVETTEEKIFNALLMGYTFVEDYNWVCHMHHSFQGCYSVADMTSRPGEYNEIVLWGTAQPAGIFVFKDYYEGVCEVDDRYDAGYALGLRPDESHEKSNKELVDAFAVERGLPVAIYDRENNTISVIKPVAHH